jgi:hypothetical protein
MSAISIIPELLSESSQPDCGCHMAIFAREASTSASDGPNNKSGASAICLALAGPLQARVLSNLCGCLYNTFNRKLDIELLS